MPSSHLPRTLCDKFVYDFPGDFFLASWLWAPAYICVHTVYGHRVISSTGPRGQPGVNPYRDCAEIVRKSCNVSAVAVQSPQPPHGNRTEPVQGSAFTRCPCGDCAMPYGLTIFFKFVKLLAKPNLTAASCLRREASQRPHGKGDTGRIRAP